MMVGDGGTDSGGDGHDGLEMAELDRKAWVKELMEGFLGKEMAKIYHPGMIAAGLGDTEALRSILPARKRLGWTCGELAEDGMTMLHMAVMGGSGGCVKMVLKALEEEAIEGKDERRSYRAALSGGPSGRSGMGGQAIGGTPSTPQATPQATPYPPSQSSSSSPSSLTSTATATSVPRGASGEGGRGSGDGDAKPLFVAEGEREVWVECGEEETVREGAKRIWLCWTHWDLKFVVGAMEEKRKGRRGLLLMLRSKQARNVLVGALRKRPEGKGKRKEKRDKGKKKEGKRATDGFRSGLPTVVEVEEENDEDKDEDGGEIDKEDGEEEEEKKEEEEKEEKEKEKREDKTLQQEENITYIPTTPPSSPSSSSSSSPIPSGSLPPPTQSSPSAAVREQALRMGMPPSDTGKKAPPRTIPPPSSSSAFSASASSPPPAPAPAPTTSSSPLLTRTPPSSPTLSGGRSPAPTPPISGEGVDARSKKVKRKARKTDFFSPSRPASGGGK